MVSRPEGLNLSPTTSFPSAPDPWKLVAPKDRRNAASTVKRILGGCCCSLTQLTVPKRKCPPLFGPSILGGTGNGGCCDTDVEASESRAATVRATDAVCSGHMLTGWLLPLLGDLRRTLHTNFHPFSYRLSYYCCLNFFPSPSAFRVPYLQSHQRFGNLFLPFF